MKISNISNNIFCKSYSNKTSNNKYKTPNISTDCFMKSNNLSFGILSISESRKQTVNSFMLDLLVKAQKPGFSIRDIGITLKKYVKDVQVIPFNKAPKNLVYSDKLQGFYYEQLEFDDDNNKFSLSPKDKLFYTKTETLNQPLGNGAVFANTIHEFTHILQSEDSSINYLNIFNNFIENNPNNIDNAINQISIAHKTANSIEEKIARPFINILDNTIIKARAYTKLLNGETDTVSWLYPKAGVKDFSTYVKEKINIAIKTSEREHNLSLDKQLVLDTAITYLTKEIEAYDNENKAYNIFFKQDNINALTKIQLYQNSIKVLNEMKKEVN